jgi:hypothetical protein
MGLLAPRVKLYPSPGQPERPLQVSACCIAIGKDVEGIQHQTVESFPLEHCPLLEGRAVGQGEAIQKSPPVQRQRFFQAIESLLLGNLPREARGGPNPKATVERDRINPGVAPAVKLNRLTRDAQESGHSIELVGTRVILRSRTIPDHCAEVGECVAQVGSGGSFGQVGPQQPS